MAITLTPKNSHFSKNLYWMGIPHSNLAVDIFMAGKDKVNSTKNLAPYHKEDGITQGTIVYSNNSALLGEASLIESNISNKSLKNTMLAVVRTKADIPGLDFAVGNYYSMSDGGIMIYASGGSLHSSFVVNTGGYLNVALQQDKVNYQLVGVSIDGRTAKIFCFENGVMKQNTGTLTKDRYIGNMRYGGTIGYAMSNFDFAFGASYDNALTDDQIKETYSHLKKLLSNRGITLS